MSDAASPGFPYRLVATDLDGTLLRSDESVSPRTRAALAAAAEAGAAHIVVTGRSANRSRPSVRNNLLLASQRRRTTDRAPSVA